MTDDFRALVAEVHANVRDVLRLLPYLVVIGAIVFFLGLMQLGRAVKRGCPGGP